MVHIYCGDGKGKTTAATGLALRALGSGKRVLFVQFFKNGDSAEIAPLKALPNLTYLKTDAAYHRFALMSDAEKIAANDGYHALLEKAIALTLGAGAATAFDLVVLDEAISCYNYGFLAKDTLLSFCEKANGVTDFEVVLTGRDPDEALLALGDYVSEIQKIKHPYDHGVLARKGIEF